MVVARYGAGAIRRRGGTVVRHCRDGLAARRRAGRRCRASGISRYRGAAIVKISRFLGIADFFYDIIIEYISETNNNRRNSSIRIYDSEERFYDEDLLLLEIYLFLKFI